MDTAVLVDLERGRLDRRQFDDDTLGIAAVTVAEFRAGAELADTEDRRNRRLTVLAEIRETVEFFDYTELTATHHARLLAEVRRTGRPRGRHDLIIAAHALEKHVTVVSNDAQARFGELPGVTILTPLPAN